MNSNQLQKNNKAVNNDFESDESTGPIYPFIRCSIENLASMWCNETGDEFMLAYLVQNITKLKLRYVDPVIEESDLDGLDKTNTFLSKNSSYQCIKVPDIGEQLFNVEYWQSLTEYAKYGATVISDRSIFSSAVKNLYIRKKDFKQWAQTMRIKLPKFWFSGVDILNHQKYVTDLNKEKIDDMNFGQIVIPPLDEIYTDENPPIVICEWMQHDLWNIQDGLMLLAGICPTSKAGMPTNFDDLESEVFFYVYTTLNGNVHVDQDCDPKCFADLAKLRALWCSGTHPDRAAPKYFIDWAIQKGMPPTWLTWATQAGILQSDNDLKSEAVTGNSRTAYLNLIAGLLGLYAEKHPIHKEKIVVDEVIRQLQLRFADLYGMKEGALKAKLYEARDIVKQHKIS